MSVSLSVGDHVVVVNMSAQPLGSANTIAAPAEVVESRGSALVH